jgi:anti-sigma factor RsiW
MAMNENVNELPEHAEIELLLPWYVTGKLETADKARVEAFLAAHPEMQHQLELVREEQDQTVGANEAFGHPSSQSLNHVMATIARKRRPPAIGSVLDRLSQFFTAPAPGAVRWATTLAAVLVLVQAAAIAALLFRQPHEGYQTASGPQSPAKGAALLVGFTDQATAPAISALLAEIDAQIIEGPKPGGVYRVRLAPDRSTRAAQDEVVQRLRLRQDIVRIVLPGTN